MKSFPTLKGWERRGRGESNANRWSNLVLFSPVKQSFCFRYDLFCRRLVTRSSFIGSFRLGHKKDFTKFTSYVVSR